MNSTLRKFLIRHGNMGSFQLICTSTTLRIKYTWMETVIIFLLLILKETSCIVFVMLTKDQYKISINLICIVTQKIMIHTKSFRYTEIIHSLFSCGRFIIIIQKKRIIFHSENSNRQQNSYNPKTTPQ